jgi:hypothetical protein
MTEAKPASEKLIYLNGWMSEHSRPVYSFNNAFRHKALGYCMYYMFTPYARTYARIVTAGKAAFHSREYFVVELLNLNFFSPSHISILHYDTLSFSVCCPTSPIYNETW